MSLYVKLVTTYYQDEKVISVGEAAELLYVRALCKAKELPTDGFLSTEQLVFLGLPNVRRRAVRLVNAGLWIEEPGGYRIAAWLKHNPSAEEIARLSATRSGVGRAGARKRWQSDGNLPSTSMATCQPVSSQVAIEVDSKPDSKSTLPLFCSSSCSSRTSARVATTEPTPATEPDDADSWEPDDPAYRLDDQYTGHDELALWEQCLGKIPPRYRLMAENALVRLHRHCRRTAREIRAWIEFIAADKDARAWWGDGKTPAFWLRSVDGTEPTWRKIRAKWLASGHSLPSTDRIQTPKPPRDPTCDCRGGFRHTEHGIEYCQKCALGRWIAAGGEP